MIEKTLTVTPKLGLHARTAALFAREAACFQAAIRVVREGVEVNGKSVMELMLLAAEHGAVLTIKADGPDEVAALSALEALFTRRFDEV